MSMRNWIRLAVLSSMLLQVPFTAPRAAEIAGVNRGGLSEIRIRGEIVAGDFEHFKTQMSFADVSRVVLDSEGGLIGEALGISLLISQNKLTTTVPDGAICASACGIIWLSGKTRVIEGAGKVGFHAIYDSVEHPDVSSSGNALVGAYLSRLGFNDSVITYVTRAQPDDMRWFTPADDWYMALSTDWQRPNPPNANIIGRLGVVFRLRDEKIVSLLKDRKLEYEQFVNDVYAARLEGQSWSNAIYSGMIMLRLEPALMRSFNASLTDTHASQLLNISFVRFGNYLVKANNEACFKLFEDDANPVQQLFATGPDDIKQEYLSYLADSLETALKEKDVKAEPVTAADRRYLTKQLDRLMKKAFAKLPSRERRRLQAAAESDEKVLRCKLYLLAMGEGSKDKRLVRALLEPEKKPAKKVTKAAKTAN